MSPLKVNKLFYYLEKIILEEIKKDDHYNLIKDFVYYYDQNLRNVGMSSDPEDNFYISSELRKDFLRKRFLQWFYQSSKQQLKDI